MNGAIRVPAMLVMRQFGQAMWFGRLQCLMGNLRQWNDLDKAAQIALTIA